MIWREGLEMDFLFPMMVKLESRRCIVVGGGEVAASKTDMLLGCGAQVVVIAQGATESIQALARQAKLEWTARDFVAADLNGAFLVVAATNSSAVNEEVFRAGRERGVLCNVVDDPEHCDFFYPAVVRRGALQIAISTAGYSPALAHRLRLGLEQEFCPTYGAWLGGGGQRRRGIIA